MNELTPFARRFFEQRAPDDLHRLARSEAADQSLFSFWEERHSEDNRLWLTGSSGEEVWARLRIRDRLAAGSRVLNIGVGLGGCTHDLAALGIETHALDIAPSALARVKGIATTWNAEDLHKLPGAYFDVALSHLVAQHMNDKDLVLQIREVTRAVRRNGVFAMQFAHPSKNEEQSDTRLNAKAGAVLRTQAQVYALASAAGVAVALMETTEEYSAFDMGWSVAHFRKA